MTIIVLLKTKNWNKSC